MLLAAAGLDVTVLEKDAQVGGRTRTIEHEDYRFDLGPTFFLYPRVLEEIFTACNAKLHDEVDLVRLDPQYHLIFEGGGDLLATPDVARMKAELTKFSQHDADHLTQYLADNRRKFDRFRPILQRPFNSWRDVLAPEVLAAVNLLRPWASVDRDLRRHFRDPRTRLAFSFQSKYLGMSPFQCPSLFTILSFIEYEFGVWHPMGGCGSITEAMERVARRMGVKVRLNEPVEQLLFDGRKATGVITTEGEYLADRVVINADFAHAMNKLVPDRLRTRWTDQKLDRKNYSCSTFMMYLGLEGQVDGLAHHTIFLANDYERNLHEIEHSHTVSANPSFYVQNVGVTDHSMAPEGNSALYCLAPVTHQHGNLDWTKERAAFRQTFYRQLEKLGLKDLHHRVRFERIVTPHDWQHEFAIYKGATFNLSHTLRQMLHLRPRNRFEDLDHVYLVGGGTHPGSGLPVIFESAKITARLLLEDVGVPTQVTGQLPEPIGASASPSVPMDAGVSP